MYWRMVSLPEAMFGTTISTSYGQKTQTSLKSVTCSFPQAHLEWAFPAKKQRLQSRFQSVVDPGGIQDALGADGAYVTGTVNQELLLRNEYLGAENRILRRQIKGRVLL